MAWSRCPGRNGGAHEWDHYEASQEHVDTENQNAQEEAKSGCLVKIVVAAFVIWFFWGPEKGKVETPSQDSHEEERIKSSTNHPKLAQPTTPEITEHPVNKKSPTLPSVAPTSLPFKVGIEFYRKTDEPNDKVIRVKSIHKDSLADKSGEFEVDQKIISINNMPTAFKSAIECEEILVDDPAKKEIVFEIRVTPVQTKVVTLVK